MFTFKKVIHLLIDRPNKILPHLKTRLAYLGAELFKGQANFPHTIYLGISNRCNLSCKMCDLGQKQESLYHKYLTPKTELPLSAWKNFIDEVAPFKPAIELCAAEPFLYKDFAPLVKYIKLDKKLVCRIFTNGFFLEEYSQLLKDIGIDYIFISIDGPAEIHDYIRGHKGLFDKVIRGIFKLEGGPLHKRACIDINFTISEHNFDRIIDTFNCLNSAGVQFDRFTVIQTLFTTKNMVERHNGLFPDYPMEPICHDCVNLNAIDISMVKSQLLKLTKEYPRKVRVYPEFNIDDILKWYKQPEEFVGNKRCLFVWNSSVITSEGEVVPYFRCVKKNFGNIARANFKYIWNQIEFKKFRLLLKKTGMFPICARCSASF